jgi:hypothetical protein
VPTFTHPAARAPGSRRPLRRWLAIFGIGLVLTLAAAVGILRVLFHGEDLAASIAETLNRRMRGHVEVRSIEWPMSALPKVVTGGWVPATLLDVRVFDDRNQLVIEASRVTGEIDIHRLMLGHHDFVFRDIRVRGGNVLLEQVPEPYPLHAYDTTVISLLSAFYPHRKPGYGAGIYATTGAVFDLRDFHLEDVDLEVRIGPTTSVDNTTGTPVERTVYTTRLVLDDVDAEGFLYNDPSDPLVPRFYFQLAPRAEHATIEIFSDGKSAEYTFELDRLDVTRLAQIPRGWPADNVANTLELKAEGHSVEGGTIQIAGQLIDYWDRPYDGRWSLDVTGSELGKTINARIDPMFSGDHLAATLSLRGPYVALPRIEFTLTGLDAAVDLRDGEPPLELSLARLKGSLDLVNDQGVLDETIARGAGGEVSLSAQFGLSPYFVDADIHILRPIDLGPWLPETVRTRVGRKLSGRLHGLGDTNDKFRIDDLDLEMGLARIDGGALLAETNFDKVYFEGLRIGLGRTRARIDGVIDTDAESLDLIIAGVDAPDLGAWLQRLGAPVLAQSAQGRITVGGTMASPTARADLRLAGVPSVGEVDVQGGLANDMLTIDGASTAGLGGSLRAQGRMRVSSPWIERFDVEAAAIELGRVPGLAGVARGKLDAQVSLKGPLDRRLEVTGRVSADSLEIAGETFTGVAMCVNQPDRAAQCRHEEFALSADDEARCRAKGGRCLVARADRTGGGHLDVAVITDRKGALSGGIVVDDLPVAAITRLAGTDLPIGGSAAARLDLGGTLSAPTADGALSLLRGWIFGAFFGDATLAVEPAGPGTIRVHGAILGGRLAIDATVGTQAPYPASVTLDLRRVELDPFVDVAALIGREPDTVRAWATGRITVVTELAPARGQPPIDATVALSELVAMVDDVDAEGRPAPLTLRATSPVSVRWDGVTARLACVDLQAGQQPALRGARAKETPCPLTLATPAGAITLEGSASLARLDLKASGVLDMAFLAPLLSEYFDASGGTAQLEATIAGSSAAPQLNLGLLLDQVWVRPLRQETVVRIPTGHIGLKNNTDLGVTGLIIEVDDPYSDEHASLTVRASVKLEDFTPVRWSVAVEGGLAGKMLLAAAPQTFSRASGVAAIELYMIGEGRLPVVDGEIRLDPRQPLAITPRELRRELVLSTGTIRIADIDDGADELCDSEPVPVIQAASSGRAGRYRIALCHAAGSIDDEGRLRDIHGSLEVDADTMAMTGGDLTIMADGLPFRIPRTLDLVVNTRPLHLFRDDLTGRWLVEGTLELVTGRYIRNFELDEVLTPKAPAGGPTTPFWESYPAIGNAELRLALDVRKFAFDSNIGDVDFAGELDINGTPRDPRLDGEIRVQQGTFKLPGTRARFSRTSGSLTFSRLSRFPAQTPLIDIRSEADYRDPTGQDHLITFAAGGTLSQLTWDLSTSSGFNKGQTLTLLLSGRTPEQFRRSLGDEAVAGDPTRVDPSTNPTQSYTDQLIKDVAGDFISLLVEDSLKDVSRLDVARIEVGTGSVGFHGEKKLVDNVNTVVDLEQTVRGNSFNLRGEIKSGLRIFDRDGYLTVQSGYLTKSFDDASEEDIRDLELKLVYRLFIP